MPVQFSLSRMFQLVAVVAVLCSLLASLPWLAALGVLGVINLIACFGFHIAGKPRTARLAEVTAFLILIAWGHIAMGDPALAPRFPAWPWLIAAAVSELVTILDWFLFYHR
jgi:hypothetical protein